jgi:hypothetical protein
MLFEIVLFIRFVQEHTRVGAVPSHLVLHLIAADDKRGRDPASTAARTQVEYDGRVFGKTVRRVPELLFYTHSVQHDGHGVARLEEVDVTVSMEQWYS